MTDPTRSNALFRLSQVSANVEMAMGELASYCSRYCAAIDPEIRAPAGILADHAMRQLDGAALALLEARKLIEAVPAA